MKEEEKEDKEEREQEEEPEAVETDGDGELNNTDDNKLDDNDNRDLTIVTTLNMTTLER